MEVILVSAGGTGAKHEPNDIYTNIVISKYIYTVM